MTERPLSAFNSCSSGHLHSGSEEVVSAYLILIFCNALLSQEDTCFYSILQQTAPVVVLASSVSKYPFPKHSTLAIIDDELLPADEAPQSYKNVAVVLSEDSKNLLCIKYSA